MEIILSVLLGISLSAACGYRVFVPLLIISIASLSGHLTLFSAFSWIGTYPTLIVFIVATIVEIVAFYIPWVDNILEVAAIPIAIVAGIVVTASCISGMSPLLRWSTAIIAGGGSAAVIQSLMILLRGGSSVLTGQVANPIVTTFENVSSFVFSILGVILPLIIGVISIIMIIISIFIIFKHFRKRKKIKVTL